MGLAKQVEGLVCEKGLVYESAFECVFTTPSFYIKLTTKKSC